MDKCAAALVSEFEKISCDKSLGAARTLFNSALARVRAELQRIAVENGLA